MINRLMGFLFPSCQKNKCWQGSWKPSFSFSSWSESTNLSTKRGRQSSVVSPVSLLVYHGKLKGPPPGKVDIGKRTIGPLLHRRQWWFRKEVGRILATIYHLPTYLFYLPTYIWLPHQQTYQTRSNLHTMPRCNKCGRPPRLSPLAKTMATESPPAAEGWNHTIDGFTKSSPFSAGSSPKRSFKLKLSTWWNSDLKSCKSACSPKAQRKLVPPIIFSPCSVSLEVGLSTTSSPGSAQCDNFYCIP